MKLILILVIVCFILHKEYAVGNPELDAACMMSIKEYFGKTVGIKNNIEFAFKNLKRPNKRTEDLNSGEWYYLLFQYFLLPGRVKTPKDYCESLKSNEDRDREDPLITVDDVPKCKLVLQNIYMFPEIGDPVKDVIHAFYEIDEKYYTKLIASTDIYGYGQLYMSHILRRYDIHARREGYVGRGMPYMATDEEFCTFLIDDEYE